MGSLRWASEKDVQAKLATAHEIPRILYVKQFGCCIFGTACLVSLLSANAVCLCFSMIARQGFVTILVDMQW